MTTVDVTAELLAHGNADCNPVLFSVSVLNPLDFRMIILRIIRKKSPKKFENKAIQGKRRVPTTVVQPQFQYSV